MMTFSFADGFGMFDVTPLENLFIEEYMLRAPGDYVKAYIYGLKLCYHPERENSLKAMALSLQMEEEQVRAAFDYWERQGVLRRVSDDPPRYSFFNLRRAMEGALPEDADTRELRDFNRSVQRLFPDRLVHGADFKRVYEWVEDLGLSQETVLMMLSSCIYKDKDGNHKQRAMAYLNKVAVTWAKERICTPDAAEDYLRRISEAGKATREVLRHLGIKREPTMDEHTLMASWLKKGFALDAVLAACREMTKIQKPNFAYLDKVMDGYARQGAFAAADILAGMTGRDTLSGKAKEVMTALGVRDGSREAALEVYRACAAKGFEHGALAEAAAYLFRRGQGTPDKLGLLLDKLAGRGIFSREEVVELFLDEERRATEAAAAFLSAAGVSALPTDADRDFIRRMRAAGHGEDAIRDAAAKAQGANNPRQYAERILSGDGQAARRTGKRVSAQNYEQREYSAEQLDALFIDLSDPELQKLGGGV